MLLFSIIAKPTFGQNDLWQQQSNLPADGRFNAVSFAINGKGYICGGYNYSKGFLNDLWEYDTLSNAWSRKADFIGEARSRAVAFVVNNKAYVGLGSGQYYLNDFWEYNPSENKWTKKADFPGLAREDAVAFTIAEKAYVGTGSLADGSFGTDFWEYDPTADKWTQKSNFGGQGRSSAVAFSINGKGYLGTGTYLTRVPYGYHFMYDFWMYDPLIDGWLQKSTFPAQTGDAVGFVLGNKGFIGTGSETVMNEFWSYNPVYDEWIRRADFTGVRRICAIAFTIGRSAYLGTGSDIHTSYLLNDIWRFTPNDIVDTSINTKPVTGFLCSGVTYHFEYGITGRFSDNNIFTAQLSDTNGSFEHAVNIGTIKTRLSGSIYGPIPADTKPGTRYRVRVISSNPVKVGSDNGTDIVIDPKPIIFTNDVVAYLDSNGVATVNAREVGYGTQTFCDRVSFSLDRDTFNCSNIGDNKIKLTIANNWGDTISKTATVTVLDTLKPSIDKLSASPQLLWPPNHKMELITVHYTLTDNCEAVYSWLSVSSNDKSCNTEPDWKIIDNHHLLLRSEKSRSNQERVYCITVFAKDKAGNITEKKTTVKVSKCYNGFDYNIGSAEQLDCSIIPNPSNHYFNLQVHTSSFEKIQIRIFDLSRRIVFQTETLKDKNTFFGETLHRGMYIAEIRQGAKYSIQKIIKL